MNEVCSKCCGVKEIVDRTGSIIVCSYCNGTGYKPCKETNWNKIRTKIVKHIMKTCPFAGEPK